MYFEFVRLHFKVCEFYCTPSGWRCDAWRHALLRRRQLHPMAISFNVGMERQAPALIMRTGRRPHRTKHSPSSSTVVYSVDDLQKLGCNFRSPSEVANNDRLTVRWCQERKIRVSLLERDVSHALPAEVQQTEPPWQSQTAIVSICPTYPYYNHRCF